MNNKTEGWTMEDWRTFYDLKTKANLFNLEAARELLKREIPQRAQQMIIKAFEEKNDEQ